MGDRSRFSQKSNADLTQKISKSVFITNFSDHIRARDLWIVCKKYGSVVDVYIPFKKSKIGKRFAFVRFIKVSNLDLLIENLCTIWIRSFHLHANSVRFQREAKPRLSSSNNDKRSEAPTGHTAYGSQQGVRSWFESIKPTCNSFVPDERIIWTKTSVIINESFKIIIKGKVHWIRAKELDAWVSKFLSEDDSNSSDSSDEDSNNFDGGSKFGDMEFINPNDESDAEKKVISLHVDDSDPTHPPGFTPENKNHIAKDTISSPKDQVQSNLSINFYSCSNVGMKSQRTIISGGSILDVMDDLVKIGHTMGYNMDGCLGHKAKKRWINELCSKHKINFAAIQETKMESIDLFSIKALWANLAFDHAVSSVVGNSGGILCVWDPNMFIKDHVSSSDYFLTIMGTWTPTSTKLLVISIYAPQELSEKRDLWDYICNMIDRWDGEIVVLGDFNEVRTNLERFGFIFNPRGANVFNNFISKADLIDILLGGYSFTWSHKSATKMSKLDRFFISKGLMVRFPNLSGLCLERHLSDHRLIIMFESSFDYGPTPFRMFHSRFKLEGFDNLVETSWLSMDFSYSNGLIRLKKKLQLLKSTIKTWVKENKAKIIVTKSSIQHKLSEVDKVIDQGGGTDEILNLSSSLIKDLNDINSIDAKNLSQKAKIHWSIEGDENSKFFHGILNIRRSQTAIRGIFLHGDWIMEPKWLRQNSSITSEINS
nr:RNA-directed DNA polymerase, eukaryota [Tanacetum cinerariifolium]